MNEQIKEYISKYPSEIIALFDELRAFIYESASGEINETLWAKLPSYYLGESFVRLIPFKDHINIEAAAVIVHKDELEGYKLTPKGMLQLFIKNELPKETLKRVFSETLSAK